MRTAILCRRCQFALRDSWGRRAWLPSTSRHFLKHAERAPESWRKRDEERRVIIDAEAKEADFMLRVRLPYYAGASREYRENLIRLATAQTRDALAQFRAVLG